MLEKSTYKKVRNTLATAALAFAVSTASLGIANNAQAETKFSDVKKGAFYEQAVYNLSEKKVIGGYSDGTFKPNKPVTRAEAAKMLAFDLGLKNNNAISKFSDVKNADWFFQPVTALFAANAIGGYEDGTFKPEKTITRAEMASMITKAYSLTDEGSSNALPFTDVNPKSWYANAVKMLFENKITSGKAAGKFAPNDPVTRGEIASFMNRVNEISQVSNPDVPTVESVTDSSVTISGKTYSLSEDVKGIFSTTNAPILNGATIQFTEDNGVLTKVTALQLNTSGQSSPVNQEFKNNYVLDGQGSTIDGNLQVNASYITLKNLTVNGNLVITNNLKNDFYSEKLTVKGTTNVNGGDANTVVFKNGKLALVNITKEGVRVELAGTTSVSEVSISTNSSLSADESVSIPELTLSKDAKLVLLNGAIKVIEVEDVKGAQLKGTATIEEMNIKNGATISIEGKNVVKRLIVEKGAKVTIGTDVKITDLKLPSGVQAKDVITNFETAKTIFEKINGSTNADYNKTTTPVTGSGGGGTVTTPDTQAINAILDSYESQLNTMKNEAQAEFDRLLANDDAVGLLDLYDSTKAKFGAKYNEIETKLVSEGLTEQQAKDKVTARYTQLNDWKNSIYNSLLAEGFPQEVLDELLNY